MNMWGYGFGWFFPGILWVLFWIFVIAFLFGGRRRWHNMGQDYSSEKTAEEILSERFARGEIDQKEYEHRMSVLQKHTKLKK